MAGSKAHGRSSVGFCGGTTLRIDDGRISGPENPAFQVGEAGSRFGLSKADAAEYVERFLDDLKRGLNGTKEKS